MKLIAIQTKREKVMVLPEYNTEYYQAELTRLMENHQYNTRSHQPWNRKPPKK